MRTRYVRPPGSSVRVPNSNPCPRTRAFSQYADGRVQRRSIWHESGHPLPLDAVTDVGLLSD